MYLVSVGVRRDARSRVDAEVAVRVDEAGDDHFARRIDDARVRGDRDVGADRDDALAVNDERTLFNDALCHRQYARVLERDRFGERERHDGEKKSECAHDERLLDWRRAAWVSA